MQRYELFSGFGANIAAYLVLFNLHAAIYAMRALGD
jgi:hypothetical protein